MNSTSSRQQGAKRTQASAPHGQAFVATSARHSIRTWLLSVTGGLALLLTAVLGWQAAEAWSRHSAAAREAQVTAAGNKFIGGTFELLMERLATNNALQANDPISSRAEIDKRRQATIAGMSAGFTLLSQTNFPERDRLVRGFEDALRKVDDYRRRADEDVKKPKSARDQDLVKTYIPVVTALASAARDMWVAALHSQALGDPMIARYASIKQYGWILRDTAGSERSIVAAAISGAAAIPADKLAEISAIRAKVDLVWQLVADLAADPRVDSVVRKAIDGAKSDYFGGFRGLSNDMQKLSAEGKPYTMATAQWVDTTTPQLGTLLEVMYAGGKGSEAYGDRARNAALQSLFTTLTMLFVGLTFTVFGIVVITRRIVTPLSRITGVVGRLAAGDTKVEVVGADRHDEIGTLARAVTIFKTNMGDAERLRAEQEETKRTAEAERKTAMIKLADNLEASVKGVVTAVSTAATQMQTSARALSATAESASKQSTAVAAASEEASTNVQTVASASEELSASISEIGRQVTQSAKIASQAVDEAGRTNQSVQGLAEAAQKIGEVVKLINDIAGQTNLLALNATIEAARAGEAGKGFAVVASEVKSLANQTAKATEDIAAQINAIQAATNHSVTAIQGIGKTIGEINEIATTIAAAVEQQGAATQEISRNVQQASAGTNEVSANIAGVTQAAGETGQAASQLLTAATDLSRQSETLRSEVDRFLAQIRAA